MEPIGVVGLGLMGSALSERLRAAGHDLVGFDVREVRTTFPGEVKESAREVFEATRTVVLSLPNSDVVTEVILESQPIRKGTMILDTTTGDPDIAAAIGIELSNQGVDYLDATLTGSSREARAGQLVVTAGGRERAFDAAVPLFRTFAKQWFRMGLWGTGSRAKLAINLVLGLNRAVLAEGLSFAKAYGLDPRTMLDVLRSGAAYSRAMDVKGPKMLDADFTPEARLAQHHKDVKLILAAARGCGAATPLSEAHEALLASLVDRGLGELDNSAVIRAFEAGADPA